MSNQVGDQHFSIVVGKVSGEEHTVNGLTPEMTLAELRLAVSEAVGLPLVGLRLVTNGQVVLTATRDAESLRSLGIASDQQLLAIGSVLDEFDDDINRREHGLVLSEDRRSVWKNGGADLTTVLGKTVVESGVRQWSVRIDHFGTDNESNVMIGVAHEDVPLNFVQNVWYGSQRADAFPGKLFWVKSRGNTSHHWGSQDAIGEGDIITVEADLDEGIVSFKRNGEAAEDMPSQDGLVGPVSLFINLDYHGDSVSIVD